MSLDEWCLHTTPGGASFERITVLQPTADYLVPLPAWLRAAALHIGGDGLKRKQLTVFWWNAAPDGPAPTVPPPPSQRASEPKRSSGAWRAATVIGFNPHTGLFTLKYHSDPKKQVSQIYLPLALIHFARMAPPAGAFAAGTRRCRRLRPWQAQFSAGSGANASRSAAGTPNGAAAAAAGAAPEAAAARATATATAAGPTRKFRVIGAAAGATAAKTAAAVTATPTPAATAAVAAVAATLSAAAAREAAAARAIDAARGQQQRRLGSGMAQEAQGRRA
ncbi:hypothetical protein Vretimale_12460 [Volvox reticuliferus]|uniref:Uncharacterized protein n=1 Tax=Volvox reticuliferus TaxID=1737510 RepID=A0A8J4GJT7_9CHLO|nr:hypothetical protein Vretimale_12460 [Volvox reticuliferus]